MHRPEEARLVAKGAVPSRNVNPLLVQLTAHCQVQVQVQVQVPWSLGPNPGVLAAGRQHEPLQEQLREAGILNPVKSPVTQQRRHHNHHLIRRLGEGGRVEMEEEPAERAEEPPNCIVGSKVRRFLVNCLPNPLKKPQLAQASTAPEPKSALPQGRRR